MEELFNPVSILLHTLNASILLIAVYFLLYKPVRKFMKAREDKIDMQLAAGRQAEEDAAATRQESAIQAQKAKQQIAETLADGQKRLKTQEERMLENARTESEKIISDAREEADAILKSAHESMQAQVAALALDIAKAILEREVRPEDNDQLILDFLKKVS